MAMTAMTTIVMAVIAHMSYNTYKNNENQLTEQQASENEAEIVMRHLDYDGQNLNMDVLLDKYNREGESLEKNIPLKEMVKGRKCVAVFSSNNCMDCAKHEMTLLNNMNCRQDIITVYDTPIHEHSASKRLPLKHYYEVSKGTLSHALQKNSEYPILLYVEDGKIITSCVAHAASSPFTRHFHEFVLKKINEE